MIEKDLVVVGHGRGATSYAAAWLQRQSIDVEHEHLGPQGIVDSGLSVPDWGIRGGIHAGSKRDAFNFKNKMCILRDPWKVIATYEQVEHPRAIFNHVPFLTPNIVEDLLPEGFTKVGPEFQEKILENNRSLRVNTIARSVVRWTKAGIEYAGAWKRAEDQWPAEMPDWLNERGLWKLDTLIPVEVPKDTINHRKGRRLTTDKIKDFLRTDVLIEVMAYCREYGYAE